LTDLYHSMAHN